MISVQQPSLGNQELQAVKKVFDSHWLGMGKEVKEFEEKLKDFLEVKHVICIGTGTFAIHLALDVLGIGPGDEVIVPSLTFVSSIHPIIQLGAKPVFCDIEEDTLNIDTNEILKKITKNTKVILSVDYSGLPCNLEKILAIAKKHHLRTVEDAAHAFGSTYKGKKIGGFSDITCFSFDPIKNITCGEGGALVTNNDSFAKLTTSKRIMGIDNDTWTRYKNKRNWFYRVTTLGYRYHMSNINAAIGLTQLVKLPLFLKRKREIVKKYDASFANIKGVQIIKHDYQNTAPFNYILKIKNGREQFMAYLKEQNIATGVHYIPNHTQPFFKKYHTKLPVTERVWKEIVTLPLYVEMSNQDVSRVIKTVKAYFKR